jgi:DNA polymerase III epsilon subunit-like protein
MKILVLDTETTGLDILKHEIIQIGFLMLEVKDKEQQVLYKKEINIKPIRLETADKKALEINGFTKRKWRGSKPFEAHAEEINKAISEADYMLGQNLIFDLRFISQSFKNLSLDPPKFPKYIDTKKMGAELVKEGKMKSASMDKMCEHFQIKFEGNAHTALTDCERTLSVWNSLLKENIRYDYNSFKKPFDPYLIKEKKKK